MVTVCKFPSGFRREAGYTFGWLQRYQFSPQWVENPDDKMGTAIAIPENEVSQLRLLQKTNPALWGSSDRSSLSC